MAIRSPGCGKPRTGRHWLTRLVVATLYTFGLKRGVGLDTMSEFFARLRLETQVGCSPSALRGVMQALEATLLETAAAWEQDGVAAGEVREIIGAVDETFLEQHDAGLSGRAHGVSAAGRGGRRSHLCHVESGGGCSGSGPGHRGLYLVSDRAKALIQLAEQGLGVPEYAGFLSLRA